MSTHVTSVAGVSGKHNVAHTWKSYFEQLYNSKKDSKYHSALESKLTDTLPADCSPVITVTDMHNTLWNQKRKKAPGPDGIHMESYMFGGHRLFVLLSVLFNMLIRFSYTPSAFCGSIIVPLVKCKTGNRSDVNNYRACLLYTSPSPRDS